MTQALPRRTLAVRITPTFRPYQFTESVSFATQDTASPSAFLLYPSEPGEIQVELQNLSDRPRQWRLDMEGDFPTSWFEADQTTNELVTQRQRLTWEESGEIAPGEILSRRYRLAVPQDFFENQQALSRGRSQLQLKYQSQIFVHESDHLIGYDSFNFYINPWCAYLNFLPAIYRETDFMGRFLSIFEQAFDPVVQTTDVMWAYLDPLTAPEALLPFLAHWVGWEIDSRWSLKQQRYLIRNAITLYRWHGTRWGLRFYLRLYLGLPIDPLPAPEADPYVSIEEPAETGLVFGKAEIGQKAILGGGRAYHFIVRLHCEQPNLVDNPSFRKEIEAVIERQKPAFCTYELIINRRL
ncbi:phage tail protein [Leptolyngbya sp. FACHB-671]|uniref:phage tail protein n=1 Tax=Leptolyngbya sp. FACHB-671 TaxID=2692812 RepID=UPI00168247C5|nr:phage tail protein [Leptolyngbya sp. FACHB-671]MBD1867168.1 phage tail protein [Cyanobacteria bacterium FACHB-471]MBD2066478.1 phage tail protein [Leptolyngbya sp. FACHB-671]